MEFKSFLFYLYEETVILWITSDLQEGAIEIVENMQQTVGHITMKHNVNSHVYDSNPYFWISGLLYTELFNLCPLTYLSLLHPLC